MTAADDLATVVRLACLTEDRSDSEQRALLRVADRLDADSARQTVTNRGWAQRPPLSLYELVQDTRDGDPLELAKRRGGKPREVLT